jgi:hypothetical protein
LDGQIRTLAWGDESFRLQQPGSGDYYA